MKAIRKRLKAISALFTLLFLYELFFPTVAMAITGQASMPEYRSFEPVATTNMVNVQNGSFTYNLPVLEVPGGYPISLYHGDDVNNEALASWVGLGWTINPGAINRMKRGFPDEFNDKPVTYHKRRPASWTVGLSRSIQPEIFGEEGILNSSLGHSLTFNNYTGIGTSVNAGLGFAGVANLNFVASPGSHGFSAEVNPLQLLNVGDKFRDRKKRRTTDQNVANLETIISKLNGLKDPKKKSKLKFRQRMGNLFSARAPLPISYPTTLSSTLGLW